jgi:hypothetical protein
MRYRLYLTNDTAPISPTANSGWEDSASITRSALSTTKAGTNVAYAVAETDVTAGRDIALGQWISEPMTVAGTFAGGEVRICVARLESDAAADLSTRFALRILSSDGSTARLDSGFVSATEWATSVTAVDITATMSSATVQVGDRIVVEYGYKAGNASTTSFTGTIRSGGTDATDLQNADTGANATTRSPWVEFPGELADFFVTTPARTRFYLTSSAAPITGTVDSGWEDTGGVTRGLLSPTKAGANAAISRAETSASATHDVLLGQWVSAPMTHAGTIPAGVTFDACLARLESDAAANFTARFGVRVVSGDGSTTRGGTFFSGSGSEFATTATAVRHIDAALVADIECQVGDRLVFEYGYRTGNTDTASFTGTVRHGGTHGTDLGHDDTGTAVTERSPWVEFESPTVADRFSTAGTSAWAGTIDATLAVEAAWGADLTADDDTWLWSDITTDVRYDGGIELVHGRGDESSVTQPASCRLTLDNRSGDYSIGPESANYPFVRRGTPIRVRVDAGTGWFVLFQGAADTWNPSWAGGPSGDATVALNASGTLRRLEQGAAPVQSVFTRAIAADTSTVAHWPLEDDANSDVGSSSIEGAPPMQYTGAAPTFGASSGEFVGTASMVTLSGARLVGEVPAYTLTSAQCIRWLAAFPSGGLGANEIVLARIYCPGGTAPLWEVVYDGEVGLSVDGNLAVRAYNTAGSEIEDSGFIAFDVDGRSLMMSLEMTQDGADIDYLLVVREVGLPGVSQTSGTITTDTFGAVSFVEFNPNGDIDSLPIGQVHVQNAIVTLNSNDANILLNAHRFERANTRIQRLCDENDVPLTITGTVAVRMGPQGTGTLVELLRECEATEQGVLFDGYTAGLSYSGKTNVVSQQNPDLTLDASAGEVDQPVPVDDDQRTRNLIVASRPNGGSALAVDTDGPMGTAAIGIYDEQVTVSPESDTFLPDYAGWFVHRGTVRGYRYPEVSFQLHRDPGLVEDWLDAMVPGERVDITNIEDVRSQHPAGTISLIIEGYRQRIDQFTWFVDLVCSPFEPHLVTVVADESGDTNENTWRLESDGAVLDAAAAAGATSLLVHTPDGPIWTTTADDFPLYIEVDGTRIEVTAISGTTRQQTFTVTGSTVPRALPLGAEVKLWQQPVLALPF